MFILKKLLGNVSYTLSVPVIAVQINDLQVGLCPHASPSVPVWSFRAKHTPFRSPVPYETTFYRQDSQILVLLARYYSELVTDT